LAALLLVGLGTIAQLSHPAAILADSPPNGGWARWTLLELGYQDVQLVHSQAGTKTLGQIQFTLPDNASQGPSAWYLIYLHVRFEIDETSEGGMAWFSASTNGFAAIQVKFEQSGRPSGTLWSTVDLINGGTRAFSLAQVIELPVVNYLQVSGVKEGINFLTFDLRYVDNLKFRSVVVLNDSAIVRAPYAPPRLQLSATTPKASFNVGDTLPIVVRVANNSWPAKDVSIRLVSVDSPRAVEDLAPVSFRELASDIEIKIYPKLLQAGNHRLVVRATSRNAGAYEAVIRLKVLERNSKP
jgi:hypothetical protein